MNQARNFVHVVIVVDLLVMVMSLRGFRVDVGVDEVLALNDDVMGGRWIVRVVLTWVGFLCSGGQTISLSVNALTLRVVVVHQLSERLLSQGRTVKTRVACDSLLRCRLVLMRRWRHHCSLKLIMVLHGRAATRLGMLI